jgi:hypothetical protein
MAVFAWRSITSGIALMFGVLASSSSLSSPSAGDDAASATPTGIAIYGHHKPTRFLVGDKPPIDEIVFFYHVGKFSFSSPRLAPVIPHFDVRGKRLTVDEYLAELAKDQPLLDQMNDAFKAGYALDMTQGRTDLSCMHQGVNGFLINVTFNDGMQAFMSSDIETVDLNDATPPMAQLPPNEEPTRISAPDSQLATDARIFGMIAAAAYKNPCTNGDALRQLGAGDIQMLKYQWARFKPPPPQPITP